MSTVSNNSIAYYLDANNNAFNLLRFSAAAIVIYGHSLSVGPGLDPLNDFMYKIAGVASAGFAVKLFFLLSGMLVTSSIMRTGDPLKFIIARCCRIYPALILALILTFFIVAPLVSEFSPFESIKTGKGLEWFWQHLSFQTFGTNMVIDSVTVGKWDNMNVPLWTLAPEVFCYLFLAAVTIIFSRNKLLLTLISVAIVVDCILPKRVILIFLPVGYDDFSYLPFFFSIGTLLALHKEKFTLTVYHPIALAFLALFFYPSVMAKLFTYLAISFLFLYFFTRKPIVERDVAVDMSYGLYIYGWPIQMLCLYYLGDIKGSIHFIVPFLVTALLSYFSWIYIESTSIRYGKKMIQAVDLKPS